MWTTKGLMFNRHFIPKTKWEAVDRLYDLYNGKYSKQELNKQNKHRLIGWYTTECNRREREYVRGKYN